MKEYIIFDTTDNALRKYSSYADALHFKQIMGRPDWSIRVSQRKSTKRQKAAVNFCLEVFSNLEFQGDIEDFYDCSQFLSWYLDDAKTLMQELYCEFTSL